MKRYAFKMKLKSRCREEYIRRHDAIWPEIKSLLAASGVRDYTIFLDSDTNTLFAVQSQKGDTSSQNLGGDPVVQKW